jgi:Tol biopolymer transport system component
VTPEILFISSSSEANTELETLAVSHLIQFNLLDGSTEDLTLGNNLEDTSPAYAPDSSALAFSRKYLDDQRWTPGRQLWIDPEGPSEALQYTNSPNINHYDFAWSPDGSRLAYVRFDKTKLTTPPEIWLLDPVSGKSQRIIEGGFAPKWIP